MKTLINLALLIFSICLLLMGAIKFGIAMNSMGSKGLLGIFELLSGICFMLMGGALIVPIFSNKIQNIFHNLMYPNTVKAHVEFSNIRALISNHEFEKAKKELLKNIEDNPDEKVLVKMLCELYFEKFSEPKLALRMIHDELQAGKWYPELESLVLLATDIYVQNNQKYMAADILKKAMALDDSAKELESFKTKFNTLSHASLFNKEIES